LHRHFNPRGIVVVFDQSQFGAVPPVLSFFIRTSTQLAQPLSIERELNSPSGWAASAIYCPPVSMCRDPELVCPAAILASGVPSKSP
jgi:hypothetical protein